MNSFLQTVAASFIGCLAAQLSIDFTHRMIRRRYMRKALKALQDETLARITRDLEIGRSPGLPLA